MKDVNHGAKIYIGAMAVLTLGLFFYNMVLR